MGALPRPIEELLDAALVSELTVVNTRGLPVTYPLIPLYDGDRIYMTSSVLFAKKLEHMKREPRVSVTVTDPIGAQIEPFRRATVQGQARIIENDVHTDWERVLPLWVKKEPAIEGFYKKRFAMPLFWERALIEITPVRALLWADGDTTKQPEVYELEAVR